MKHRIYFVKIRPLIDGYVKEATIVKMPKKLKHPYGHYNAETDTCFFKCNFWTYHLTRWPELFETFKNDHYLNKETK